MARVSREDGVVQDFGPVEERTLESDGYSIQFVTFREEIDSAPLLKGLPNDSCHCSHWGYVFKGEMTFRIGDREETYKAGDAFYVPPGHVPVMTAGTEYLQFSPAKELAEVSAMILKNSGQPAES